MRPMANDGPTVYLDHPATTACDPRVVEAMLPWLTRAGNAAQRAHRSGREAAEAVAIAREQVLVSLGIDPARGEVVLTSGATEANNLALLGTAARLRTGARVVTSTIEHPSVRNVTAALARRGLDVVSVGVGDDGAVDLDAALDAIDERTALVSVQAVNNETGVIQPVEALARRSREVGAVMHVDAVQSWGKVPLDAAACGIDLLSISAHKLYGPTGIGALVAPDRSALDRVSALQLGGGQERGLRPGTTNVAGAVGMGAAAHVAHEAAHEEPLRLQALRERFEEALLVEVAGARINGQRARRGPAITSLSIDGIDALELLAGIPRIAASTSSACSAGAPSHVLRAMGFSTARARSTVRLGIGRTTTWDELAIATDLIAHAVAARQPRAASPARELAPA